MNKFWLALAGVLLTATLLQFYDHREAYLSKVNKSQLEQAYQQSQYVNPDSQNWIDDPPLYNYAGIKYLEGIDPTQINFELQPLTKYAFGLSIKLFGNPSILQLVLYILLILQTFYLARSFKATPIQGVFASTFIALDPLIRLHAHIPYLDLMLTNLIILFIRVMPNYSHILNGLLVGLIALSKSFMIGALIYLAFLLFLLIQKQFNFKKVFIGSASAFITYLVGYTMFFMHGKSFIDFINLHIDIARLYRGYVPEYPIGEIIRIILFGQWRKWYGDFGLMQVDQWWIVWPLSFIATLIYFFKNRFITQNPVILFSLIFISIYFISILFKLTFPRYLMPLLPFMYIFLAKYFFDQNKQGKVQ